MVVFVFVLTRLIVYFLWLFFLFLILFLSTSRETCWEEHLQNDLYFTLRGTLKHNSISQLINCLESPSRGCTDLSSSRFFPVTDL